MLARSGLAGSSRVTASRVHWILAPLLLLAALGAASLETAHAAEAVLTVNLDPGKHKAVRMRNLPKDAVMAIAAQSTGKIAVILLNERDYRTFPRVAEPVFAGTLERTLSFQVVIPEAGHYYLVLDNQRATEARKVRLGIRAQRGRAPQPEVPDTLGRPGYRWAQAGHLRVPATRAGR